MNPSEPLRHRVDPSDQPGRECAASGSGHGGTRGGGYGGTVRSLVLPRGTGPGPPIPTVLRKKCLSPQENV